MTTVEPNADSAPRFAHLAANAFEAVYKRLAPERARMRDDAIGAWLEGHEAEAVALARGVIGAVAEHPDTGPEARAVFDLLLKPEHQTQAVLVVLGIYPIVSGFVSAAIAPFIQDIANQAWAAHTSVPLTPADVALGMLRHNPHIGNPYHEAAKSGIGKDDLDALQYNTGEPPGLQQVLEGYRRGLVTDDDLLKGVRQSRVRDEWFPLLKELRYAPPSSLEAIMGKVKGHLEEGPARKLFQEGGLNPEHFDWMLATAGRPPGAEQMLGLVNRNLMSEETFGDAIRQSDIQNRWIPYLLELRRYLPPPRSIVSMLHHNAIDDPYATELLKDHGLNDKDVAVYLAEGHASRTAAVKAETLGTVRALYREGVKDKTETRDAIVKLGYTAAQANDVIALEDHALEARYRNAATSHAHTLFIRHRIDQNDLSNELDRLGVRAEVRDMLIKLWLIERQLNVVPLTLAQTQGSWRRGVMTDAEFANRVRALGHPESDISYLKALAFPASKFRNARTVADI